MTSNAPKPEDDLDDWSEDETIPIDNDRFLEIQRELGIYDEYFND
jgi:hypothetical protein